MEGGPLLPAPHLLGRGGAEERGLPWKGILRHWAMFRNAPVAPEMLFCSSFQVKLPPLPLARCGGEAQQLPFLEMEFQFLGCFLCPCLTLFSFHLGGTGRDRLCGPPGPSGRSPVRDGGAPAVDTHALLDEATEAPLLRLPLASCPPWPHQPEGT